MQGLRSFFEAIVNRIDHHIYFFVILLLLMIVQQRHPSLVVQTGTHYRVTRLLYTFAELIRVMNLFCNRLRTQEVQIIRVLLLFS